MSSISVTPLMDDRPWGVRVCGVTRRNVLDEALRQQLRELFENRGLIVFEDMEPSIELQVELSEVFGPLKPHPVQTDRIDPAQPSITNNYHNPEAEDEIGIVELDGRELAVWLPWHFDHCYNNELNRGGILRPIIVATEGGMTGFCDGIELYNALPAGLREQADAAKIIYTLDLEYTKIRFGLPRNFRVVKVHPGHLVMSDKAQALPRAIHPAVWTRATGEKVLHMGGWMAAGIEGRENPEGDALLEELAQFVNAQGEARGYFHQWRPTDMIIWDNWRMLHSVSGNDPKVPRYQARSTIKGDYGLGYFENGGIGDKLLEMTV